MADSEVKVVISGEATGVTAAMQQAAASVRDGVSQMTESLAKVNDGFESLSTVAASLGALFAGGIFKEMVDATNDLAESSIALGISLGITTTQASIYNVAIKEVGGTSDDFAGAARGLTRALKTNEKGLNEMGIATRDANGQLLDFNTIMFNGIDAVNSYAAGTDRNLAAQTAFGRGASANSAIFRLQSEDMQGAMERAQALGLVVGGDMVEAFEKNRKAMADVHLVGQALQVQIGSALIPVLLQLGQAFSGEGSTAAKAFGQVIIWIGQAVLALWTGLKELGTMLGGIGAAANAVVHGNFAEARTIMSQLTADLKKMSDEGDKAIAKLGQTMIAAAGGGGGEGAPPGGNAKFNLAPKGEKGPDNRLALYKNALDEMSQAEGDFDKKNIQGNIDYWSAILANTVGNSKEDVKLRTEIQKEILTLEKKQHDEQIKESQEYEKTVQALELGEIAAKEVQAQQELNLGNITNAQFLQLEKTFEAQKFQIKQKAIADELALNTFDLAGQQKLKDQELLLEQQHAAAIQKIDNQAALAQNKVWQDLFKSMQSGFATTIAGFLKGTSTLGGAVKGLFQDITGSVINSLAQMAAKNLEVMLEAMLLNKTAAMAQIRANAASGAAAAYQSVVGIPYIGPFLAPAAAAVAYGAIMVFGSNVASAAAGYDIPSGTNPMTQLHQNEMVLPAKYANVIRGMAQGGGASGGMTVNISTVDARSLQRALTGAGASGPLATAIKGLNTRFVR